MNKENLTEYIKKGFSYKNVGDYKSAIDYFYKALAIDNTSVEIMNELAYLYTMLCQYDRAISFYEQVVSKNPQAYDSKLAYAVLCKKLKNIVKAKELLLEIFNESYELDASSQELFQIMFDEQEYDKIINLYNPVAEQIKSSVSLFMVASAYSKIRNNDKAEEFYNKSYELSEDNVDAGCSLAELLFSKEMYSEAEKLCFSLLKICEDDRIFYLLAEMNYLNKKFDEAIKNYSYAININQKEAVYYYKLGVVYSLKGFMNEAEQSYCKAVTIDAENILYNYTLAYLYYTNGKNGLAENLVDFILSIQPDYLSAVSLKALLLLNKNEVAKAKNYVEKLEKSSENDDFSYYVQALYYSKLNMWEKAIVVNEKAVELNSESLEYKYELAKNYLNILDLESVYELCEEILQKNDKYIQAYVLLSKVAMVQGDFDLSLTNIDKALALDINSAEVYFIKGCLYYNSDKFEQALECYKTAVSIDPKDEKNYAWVAMTYYQLEDYVDAYSYFKEAAEINIANPEYRYYMAKCSINNNDTENAISNFSLLRRLAPSNIEYAQEYADYLALNNNVKNAVTVMKSVLKTVTIKEDKEKIKKIIENLKKRC